jgi:hypothetical protein
VFDETAKVHHASHRDGGRMAAGRSGAAVRQDLEDWFYRTQLDVAALTIRTGP